MKKKFDKKYLYWGLTAFIVLAAIVYLVYILFFGVHFKGGIKKIISVFMPIIYGFILAYLTTPIVNFYENNFIIPLLRKIKKYKEDQELSANERKYIRICGIMCCSITVCIILYALFKMLIPQLIISIQSIITNLPTYANNLYYIIMSVIDDNTELENQFYIIYNLYYKEITEILYNNVMPQVQEIIKNITSGLMGSLLSILKACWNFIIGIIISIYLINSKEKFAGQAKKIIYALTDLKTANVCVKTAGYIHNTFIGFISGKIIDSAIIGLLCFVGTSIIGTPYPIVISVIIGVTNIIPFFGPYLGAIPCALLVLMLDPMQCVYFLIFIFILQQIDGNIIGPKILGDSTGLSSFWVIFSITVFGGFYGIFGMIIGVPLFAIIYAFFRYFINNKLKSKNLPIQTDIYANVSSIDNDVFINKPKKKYYRKNRYKDNNTTNYTNYSRNAKINSTNNDENNDR